MKVSLLFNNANRVKQGLKGTGIGVNYNPSFANFAKEPAGREVVGAVVNDKVSATNKKAFLTTEFFNVALNVVPNKADEKGQKIISAMGGVESLAGLVSSVAGMGVLGTKTVAAISAVMPWVGVAIGAVLLVSALGFFNKCFMNKGTYNVDNRKKIIRHFTENVMATLRSRVAYNTSTGGFNASYSNQSDERMIYAINKIILKARCFEYGLTNHLEAKSWNNCSRDGLKEIRREAVKEINNLIEKIKSHPCLDVEVVNMPLLKLHEKGAIALIIEELEGAGLTGAYYLMKGINKLKGELTTPWLRVRRKATTPEHYCIVWSDILDAQSDKMDTEIAVWNDKKAKEERETAGIVLAANDVKTGGLDDKTITAIKNSNVLKKDVAISALDQEDFFTDAFLTKTEINNIIKILIEEEKQKEISRKLLIAQSGGSRELFLEMFAKVKETYERLKKNNQKEKPADLSEFNMTYWGLSTAVFKGLDGFETACQGASHQNFEKNNGAYRAGQEYAKLIKIMTAWLKANDVIEVNEKGNYQYKVPTCEEIMQDIPIDRRKLFIEQCKWIKDGGDPTTYKQPSTESKAACITQAMKLTGKARNMAQSFCMDYFNETKPKSNGPVFKKAPTVEDLSKDPFLEDNEVEEPSVPTSAPTPAPSVPTSAPTKPPQTQEISQEYTKTNKSSSWFWWLAVALGGGWVLYGSKEDKNKNKK